ncbi:hypothetical protein SAY87_030789 [Trapa incisa]|uniref:Protein yippee-like n=2 Tax=Trapa TaxID=22665 RepID=A0AAN7R2W8_TRANT|nr:hypothetical protein SAY87_030789 [Trapa incisa]KAK4787712.1 hypothetical protein SAY86_011545 [Trapa natans]
MPGFFDSPLFSCRNCRNPLALRKDLLSKNFTAKSGSAFFFSDAMNIVYGKKEHRQLMSGSFTIAPIYCSNCGEELGWKYLRADVDKQKFKEGKFVIEKSKIIKEY